MVARIEQKYSFVLAVVKILHCIIKLQLFYFLETKIALLLVFSEAAESLFEPQLCK